MKHSHHLKETAEDVAVKDRLWAASERELLHFATRYREEHTPGERSCKAQESVVDAAAAKGYPITLIRFLGAQKRGEKMDEAGTKRILKYRRKLGLEANGRVSS